ncbi:hypothetical protein Osc7112_5802 [Oscillatoria nigro-viridis PCC 7112]|uniref:Uncharacterized protein n=1 Tax=Phormidium nigroviride PCC 7112 TaxID=179408 RepID=K9VS24_9CYAN|nr:hypothetical protein [Oscillatoria nigro-viridis]AFZ10010.1 hypothetical protein Osc7112_5802 [Oscillatoria nigro-viridis PCC 7112]
MPAAKDAGGKAGDRRVGSNFERPKDMVQRAEQRIYTVYVKNLILKNQNWSGVMGQGEVVTNT